MARPTRKTVLYFPHSCNHGQTMFILESKFGIVGYAFWFKLLENIGKTEGHYLDLNDEITTEYLQAITCTQPVECQDILDLLSKLGAIDKALWQNRIVWSDNFIKGIADVYRNRRVEIPTKPNFYRQKSTVDDISTVDNPQSKGKESKVNKSKEKHTLVPSKSESEFQDPKKDGVCVLEDFEEGLKTKQSERPSTPAIVSTQAESVSVKCVDSKNESDLFAKFWNAYPARRGVKNGKPKAIEAMYSLSLEDQELVLIAVDHYANHPDIKRGIGIKDPVNFLQDGWRDFINKIEVEDEIPQWKKVLAEL